MTRITIHFPEHGTRPGNMPVLKKLYAVSDTRFVAKHTRNGVDEIVDYDFGNLDFRAFEDGKLMPPNFNNNNFKFAMMDAGELHITFDTPIPSDASIPKTLDLTFDDAMTYPHYIFTASGETETPETAMKMPNWIKHPSRKAVSNALKVRVARVAHRFAEGYSYSWAYLNTQYKTMSGLITNDPGNTPKEVEAVQRRDATANWGRLLIGYVYRQVDRFKRSSDKQSYTAIHELVELLEAQIPSRYTIQEFHNRINVEGWLKYTSNEDTKLGREIWTRRETFGRWKKLYDINDNNTDGNDDLNTKKAEAEYGEIIDAYVEAWMQPHPMAEGRVV